MKWILKGIVLLTTGTWAMGSVNSTGSISAPRDPTLATKTIKAVIAKTQVEGFYIALHPNPDGEELVLKAGKNMSIKTKLKDQFGGRKKLEFQDLTSGQEVMLTYLPAKGEITLIKVLKSPTEANI